MISPMRAKAIYLLAILMAYLLTSCRTSKNVERLEAKSITTGRIATNVVSLDSLQRWLTGRLLITEIHFSNKDSTGAQSVEKVVRKELTFAGGEERAQEVKDETVTEVISEQVTVKKEEKEAKRKTWPTLSYFGLLVCVLILIFVEYKQLKIK